MDTDHHNRDLKLFCHVGGLSYEDQTVLATVHSYIHPLIPSLIDRLYEILGGEPEIAPYVVGRVDHLKRIHIAWLESLFAGDYGADFILRQEKIGETHVRVRVPPLFVASTMAFFRGALPPVLVANISDKQAAISATASLLRLFDLCQYLIDRKYAEVLMDNLGISPALLMRLQTVGRGLTHRN